MKPLIWEDGEGGRYRLRTDIEGRTWLDIRERPGDDVQSYVCDAGAARALVERVVALTAKLEASALDAEDLRVIRSILRPEMRARGDAGEHDVEGRIARALGKLERLSSVTQPR